MEQKAYIGSALLGLSLLTILWGRSRRPSHPSLPPGPKLDPLIGNVRFFPQKRWYETFSRWQAIYGDFIYLNVFGSVMIVCNSLDIAKELMVKRGSIHSGRIAHGMLVDVMDWGWSLVTAPPGPFHSDARTIFRKSIGAQEVVQYDGLVQEECGRLLDALKDFQGDPSDIIQSIIGATVIRVAYGDSVYNEHGKELADLNRETIELASWITSQFWLVNFVPQLHYLPDWLPFPYKVIGKRARRLTKRLQMWAWDKTVEHYKAGVAGPSIALDYLEKGENLEVVRDTLGMMYGAGVDNTAAALITFIATMLRHPEVQKVIQGELDQELGFEALPTPDDLHKLPYMDACWRESMRLNPSTPLGVPHCATEDDVYQGMYIPKGAMVMTNIGFMCRDPRLWDDPDAFKPERWTPSQTSSEVLPLDVYDIVFGFGRRICPGQYLANRTSLLFGAALLKMYDIMPLEGETTPKEIAFRDMLIRFPEGLRCQFVPRTRG